MEDHYLWNTGIALADMRLFIEGAVLVYEEEAAPLFKLARDNDKLVAAEALETVGAALHHMQECIREMQKEHINEVKRRIDTKTEC